LARREGRDVELAKKKKKRKREKGRWEWLGFVQLKEEDTTKEERK